jgi:hypothetical protein
MTFTKEIISDMDVVARRSMRDQLIEDRPVGGAANRIAV